MNLKEIFSQTVTIGGEVKKAGVYPIVGRMTLLTAIASAEGWTEYSQKGRGCCAQWEAKIMPLYMMSAIERGITRIPKFLRVM